MQFRRFVIVAVLSGLIGAAPAAQQVAIAPAAKGTVLERVLAAPALEDNLLQDPAQKRVLIYLPPGYSAETARRYPTVYILHGIFDQPDVWTQHFKVPEILDRLIASGRIPPLIAIFPQGGNRLGGGFYRNSTVSGNWGDFIASQLVSYVDSEYRSVADREKRAVIGHSMGGYGAIYLALHYSQTFSAAYAMSPCCLTPVEDLGQGNPVWRRVENLKTWDEVEEAIGKRDFYLVAAMGILTAFLPNPEKPPFYVDLPFGVERGETVIREETYNRWLAESPLYQLADHREALLSLKGLGLDYGTGDQFAHIPVGSRLLSARLAELRIPHTLDVYDGDHRKEVARRLEEFVLPWAARFLKD